MIHDAGTLAYYEQAAPRLASSGALGPHRHLDPFLDRLPARAHILELGCGCGRDAAHMIARGLRVDATDGAGAMARKAGERFDIPARTMRFDELDAVAAYDAVWAHASLPHAPRAALPGILHRIRISLVAGGYHFANYRLADRDHPDEGRDALGCWTHLPRPNWLRTLYQECGFAIAQAEEYSAKDSDGVAREWLALTVKVPPGNNGSS